jgi:hypothetical protein
MSDNATAFQADMFPGSDREPHRMRRSCVTNNAVAQANQATAAGRRVADLYRAFMREMGNPACAIRQSEALAAAELTEAAEAARVRLRAGNGDADEVVRLGGEARRAVRRLGIDRQSGGKPKQTLADYVRRKSAAMPAPTKEGAA